MKAKILVILAAALVAVPAAFAGSSGKASHAKTVTINLYASGDVNVQSLWQKNLIPAFEKQNPGIKIKFIFSEHGTNDATTLARIGVAVKQRKWSGIDIVDGGLSTTLAITGLTQPVTKATAPNLNHVNKALLTPVKGAAIPYRGSSVVLGYNSEQVPNPPKTLDALLAWIKAHSGKFTYNSPNTGGSGASFVETVLDKYMPQDVVTKLVQGYDPSLESYWKQGFDVLHGLNQYMYGNGVYPNGNQATLDLLAKGQIWAAPVWSDQALAGLKAGTLPPSIKLTQISNPSFNGGAAYLAVPRTAKNKVSVYKFVNFLLSPAAQSVVVNVMAGYPAVDLKYMPASVKTKFADVSANTLRQAYSTKSGNDMKAQWQQTVP